MKETRIPIYNENKMKMGYLIQKSNIDDIMFAIEDEIDKKEIHEQFEDCACMHGVDCFDYMGTCVYCGFQLTEEQMKENKEE